MDVEAVLAVLWLPTAVSGLLATGTWVTLDARARGGESTAPLLGIVVAGFVPLVVGYLYLRPRLGERERTRTSVERTLGVWAIGALLAAVLAPVLAPPDPVTAGWYLLGLLPVGIATGYAAVYRHRLRR